MKEFQPPQAPSASSLPACKLNSAAEPAKPAMRNDPNYMRQNMALLESVLMLRRQNTRAEQQILEPQHPLPLQNLEKLTIEFKKPRQIPKGNPPMVGYQTVDPQILRMMRHEQQRMRRNAEAMLQRAQRRRDLILQCKQDLRRRRAPAAEGDQQPTAASIGGLAAEGEQKAAVGDQPPTAASLGADQAQQN
ncbi:hypothetical protein C2S51_031545 [Perilla frutescens var. frutescens]|nr:hypothetical protein C2S51_031545 [Perilla frutescens var. frutescens]